MTADYCTATRSAFDGLITRPALTDKLLQRPPYQFMLDIVASAVKAGAFGQKLFTAEDLRGDKKGE